MDLATVWERRKASARAYYYRNREAVIAYQKRRYRDKREMMKAYTLAAKYGLTVADVKRMIRTQKGRCKICDKECKFDFVPQRGKGAKAKAFVVDHCHASGRVRGLLCVGCNVAIGLLRDDPALLRKAIQYLEAC